MSKGESVMSLSTPGNPDESGNVAGPSGKQESAPEIVAFQGAGDVFSNFYRCELFVFGMVFSSSEHAYQYQKAMEHNCFGLALQILNAPSGNVAKRLSKLIPENATWSSKKVKFLEQTLEAKFRDVKVFRELLLSTRGKILVEAVSRNYFWSSGLDKVKTKATLPHLWPGKNIMGKLLMTLRDQHLGKQLVELASKPIEGDPSSKNRSCLLCVWSGGNLKRHVFREHLPGILGSSIPGLLETRVGTLRSIWTFLCSKLQLVDCWALVDWMDFHNLWWSGGQANPVDQSLLNALGETDLAGVPRLGDLCNWRNLVVLLGKLSPEERSLLSRVETFQWSRHSGHVIIDPHFHMDKVNEFLGVQSFKSIDSGFKCREGEQLIDGGIASFCFPTQWHKMSKLDKQGLFFAVGLHPHVSDFWTRRWKTTFMELLDQDKVVALREVGLDYTSRIPVCKQRVVLIELLEIARERNLPVILHCRDKRPGLVQASEDCISVLSMILPRFHKVYVHCFTGPVGLIDSGCNHFLMLCLVWRLMPPMLFNDSETRYSALRIEKVVFGIRPPHILNLMVVWVCLGMSFWSGVKLHRKGISTLVPLSNKPLKMFGYSLILVLFKCFVTENLDR